MKPAITSIATAEETFSFDVSDEALEIAAQAKEKHMSTFGGKADIARAFPNVHSSPKADIGRADCELGRPTFAFSCPGY